jgi:hypothetical protein
VRFSKNLYNIPSLSEEEAGSAGEQPVLAIRLMVIQKKWVNL